MSAEAQLSDFLYARTSTRGERTGSWRFLAPVYIEAVPPCSGACPAGTDVRGWLKEVVDAGVPEAARFYIQENPLPAITGRVCHHPCESVCSRAENDGAVAIQDVERALGDEILRTGYGRPAFADRDERVAVVGSGPAGLSAAYYLRALGYGVTVFEAAPVLGGMLRVGIPAYRMPREILARQIERLAEFGVEFRVNAPVDLQRFAGLEAFAAVFVATGLHAPNPLRIAGEEEAESAVSFLRAVALGEAREVGERVVVIGGGEVALDCARTSLRLGARDVTVASIEPDGRLRASEAEIREARVEGVHFQDRVLPEHIENHDGLRTVYFSRVRMPEGGFRRIEELTVLARGAAVMKADTVIFAIGQRPAAPIEAGEGRVLLGGDADGGEQTVARAIGSGKLGAMRIHARLAGLAEPGAAKGARVSWVDFRAGRETNVRPLPKVNDVYFAQAPRPEEGGPTRAARTSWTDWRATLSAARALEAAERCYHCGSCTECDNCLSFCPDTAIHKRERGFGYDIDYDHCKGCGVCVQECPRGSMLMVADGDVPPVVGLGGCTRTAA